MNTKKSILSLLLVFALLISSSLSAFATVEDTGFNDVDAHAWYAQAATYLKENDIMLGTSQTEFSPEQDLSRAMVATVLWHIEGEPTAQNSVAFEDVVSGQWYSDAIAWVAQNGLMVGYGTQTFGTNDALTREQLVTVLFRYAEEKGIDLGTQSACTYTDAADIADWAIPAAAWAQANGLIHEDTQNVLSPKQTASRGDVAFALYGYLTTVHSGTENPMPEETDETILITYFSRTGTTKGVAETIHGIVGGDLLELVPATAYPTDYNNCLAVAQQELNAGARPELSTTVDHIDDYDIIFVGYPIWYGTCPMAIFTFLEAYDLSGKTIVPFATSGSTGISRSEREIGEICDGSTMLTGLGLSGSSASSAQSAVERWLDGLDLPQSADHAGTTATNDATRISLTFGPHEVTAVLEDNATSRDFLSMLPMTMSFEDYNSHEKIAYPPRPLSTQGAQSGYDPEIGDITLYMPWGNLAIFYTDGGYSSQLAAIGHIESGTQLLAAMTGTFDVTITRVDG